MMRVIASLVLAIQEVGRVAKNLVLGMPES